MIYTVNWFNFTLIGVEDAGNVTCSKRSSAKGGIKRSPFLTAPFTKILYALGLERILWKEEQQSNFYK